MAARDIYLALVDKFREELDTVWGHRQHEVYVRVTTTTPGAPSYGSYGGPGFSAAETVTETRITVGPGSNSNPKVEQIKQQDVVASGGLYQTQDLRVGPLTPTYPGGGLAPDSVDPPQSAAVKTVAYRVVGPSTPPEGAIYAKVGQTITTNYGYYLVLRKTAEEPI